MPYLMHSALTVLLLLANASVVSAEDLNVPPETIEGGSPGLMMHRYLAKQTDQAIERWKDDYEKRKTPEEIAAYQKRLREAFLKAIGGLPERTPLNPQVVGTVSRPGYRVEKVLFQSQPKHYVTGAAVSARRRSVSSRPIRAWSCRAAMPLQAKGYHAYQSMGALLALNGMAALVFDPIDQGERGQYMGKGGWPKFWGIDAHTMVGVGSILLGRNTARFEIWDGMRAIDYLQSRPEVDPKRIGCTGNSGGGTQTSYLMALDDRIRAAAPSCYLTSTSRMLGHASAPQDAEQHIFGQLISGLDHADFVMMRAPSPVLMLLRHLRFLRHQRHVGEFPLRQAPLHPMGFAERVDILENDAGHNYNTVQREAAVRWMSRWLLRQGQGHYRAERRTAQRKGIHLHARRQGDVAAGRTLGLRSERGLREHVGQAPRGVVGHRRSGGIAPKSARSWRASASWPICQSLASMPVGTIARKGYKIEKLVIRPEEGIALPALLFLPEKPNPDRVVLYLNDKGKAADAAAGGPIEQTGSQRRHRAGRRSPRQRPNAIDHDRDYSAPTSKMGRLPTCSAAQSLECGRKTSSSARGMLPSERRVVASALLI